MTLALASVPKSGTCARAQLSIPRRHGASMLRPGFLCTRGVVRAEPTAAQKCMSTQSRKHMNEETMHFGYEKRHLLGSI